MEPKTRTNSQRLHLSLMPRLSPGGTFLLPLDT